MIISKNINPERDIYYLGAKVIELIADKNDFNFFDVFQKLHESEKISMQLFALVLDWLFILGIIYKDSTGTLQKCF